MEKFWMVMKNNAQNFTRVRHTTEHSARAEAERLAREYVGDKFYILGVIDAVTAASIPVIWESEKEPEI